MQLCSVSDFTCCEMQGEHGLSRHFEGTPSSIQKLAAETNMQGLQNENLNKAKVRFNKANKANSVLAQSFLFAAELNRSQQVASMLESASVFRTPMPKIPQHMSKVHSRSVCSRPSVFFLLSACKRMCLSRSRFS